MSEQIVRTEYSEVMQKSYIDYAMSTICARAIPDVRDGLKPVQRRVLYAMEQLGLNYNKPHRKSARIVGDAMGKYHPHGDSSIYDALVVLSQDFKKGMALVDGHGNFGSIEGDGAAAMRYTEAKLKKFTQDVYLADLDKDVVDFVPNFDETEKEPAVLPVRIPNILINGAEGIAVGMTTSIPTHNLAEVIDAMIAYMGNEKITVEELMEYVPGPDFPTGGIVVNKDELLEIYQTGTGKIKLRGKVEFEPAKKKSGKDKLVITEIPYTMIGANISKFISDVVDLVESKKTSDITDITNESSKEGIRIVLELKKGADVEKIKNLLYKKTKLEDTFGVNMLGIADGKPEQLNLKSILAYNIEFQYEILTRKYTTLLEKAYEQKEVKEGLIRACNIIDLIIEIIRGSNNLKQAKECLISGNTEGIKFKNPESEILASNLNFTERQAQAILELRLYKLIGLEILALQKEFEELVEKISEYEDILHSRKSMAKVLKKDLLAIKKEYALPRKTVITNAKAAEVIVEEIKEQEVIFVMDKFGYAKLLEVSAYDRNKDSVDAENTHVFSCMNTDKIVIFTDNGNMHQIKVLKIPSKRPKDKGVPIDNLGNYSSAGESIVGIYAYNNIKDNKLLFTTKMGIMKLVDASEFDVNRSTISATKLQDDDLLVSVNATRITTKVVEVPETDEGDIPLILSGGSDDGFDEQLGLDFEAMGYGDIDIAPKEETQYTREILVLQTHEGYYLRFPLKDVPEKKKNAIGVKGIKLTEGDYVRTVFLLDVGDNKIVQYKGKKVELRKLNIAKRGGRGSKGK